MGEQPLLQGLLLKIDMLKVAVLSLTIGISMMVTLIFVRLGVMPLMCVMFGVEMISLIPNPPYCRVKRMLAAARKSTHAAICKGGLIGNGCRMICYGGFGLVKSSFQGAGAVSDPQVFLSKQGFEVVTFEEGTTEKE